MADQNYYRVLGLSEHATQPEIKRAYHKLAREYHPDSGGSEQSEKNFQALAEAYGVLSDPEKRADYDRNCGFEPAARKVQSDSHSNSQENGPGPRTPMDSSASAEQPLDSDRAWDFLQGRVRNDSSALNSARFSGTNLSRFDENSFFNRLKRFFESARGIFRSERSKTTKRSQQGFSDMLRGERQYVFTIDALESLTGTSRELAIQTPSGPQVATIQLDPGIASGAVVQVQAPDDGPKGMRTITVKVNVVPHPYISRERNDVTVRLPITVSEAIKGAELEVPIVGGSVRVKIPAGTNATKKLRLKAKGIKNQDGQGDLYVQPVIVAPDQTSDSVQAAAEALQSAYATDVRKDFPKRFR